MEGFSPNIIMGTSINQRGVVFQYVPLISMNITINNILLLVKNGDLWVSKALYRQITKIYEFIHQILF